MKKKYTLKLNDLEKKGGVERLMRDGFTRQDISQTLYKATEGASSRERESIMSQLHDKR